MSEAKRTPIEHAVSQKIGFALGTIAFYLQIMNPLAAQNKPGRRTLPKSRVTAKSDGSASYFRRGKSGDRSYINFSQFPPDMVRKARLEARKKHTTLEAVLAQWTRDLLS